MDSTNSGGFDASLLEGLPINQFNWGEWNVSLFNLFVTLRIDNESKRKSEADE
jgi:hypothetical protein